MFLLNSCRENGSSVKGGSSVDGVDQEQVSIAKFTHKKWHVVKDLDFDPVSLPSVKINLLERVKIGNSLNEVIRATGHMPLDYYYDAKFLVMHASSDEGKLYEVAFLIEGNEPDIIKDISFREIIYSEEL